MGNKRRQKRKVYAEGAWQREAIALCVLHEVEIDKEFAANELAMLDGLKEAEDGIYNAGFAPGNCGHPE